MNILVTAFGLAGAGLSTILDPLLNLAELPPPDADQANPPTFNDPAWLLQNPVIQKLCHHPHDLQGLEGELFADYQLEEVHVVLTSGEISPSTKSQGPGIQPPEFNCMFKSCEQNNADFLNFKKTADLYFASNRNKLGFKGFPASPNSEVCLEGELTPKGVVQLLTVGRNLQEAYFFRSFHNRYLPKAEILDIHGITTSVAFQSLLAFLHGFLPEKQIVKTLIWKSSKNFCSSVNSSIDNCHCNYLDELLPQIQRAVHHGHFIFKDDFISIAEVEKTLNSPRKGKLSAVELYSLLMPLVCKGLNYQCHNLTGHFMKFTKDGMLLLINKTFEHFISLSKDPVFRTFSDSYSYPFLEAMVTNTYSKRWLDKRIHLYSGDQTFLISLLTSLGTSIEEHIPPATRLVFEMYRGQTKRYYVRVLLNGNVITQKLSMCEAGITATHGMCPLVALADFLRQKVSSLPCYR
ncbi:hypothetical protein CHS0354_000142 [Potamilus streckersoni]|uniref:Uncharacterized protein n=1 Tax=Potamilus streckersoni TaxID=2493646 RepID=A0AAE0W2X7_9BIVA|nr:hypothetical protein CHS0354_000142 [Potamilus streckersoni]